MKDNNNNKIIRLFSTIGKQSKKKKIMSEIPFDRKNKYQIML
jgi:hypothetical protein